MSRQINSSKFTHLNRSAGPARAYAACGVDVPVVYVTDETALVDCALCKRTLAYADAISKEAKTHGTI